MNPWIPVSACGPSCVSAQDDRAGRLRVIVRILGLALLLLTLVPAGVLTLATPRRVRVRYWRFTARCGLLAFGVRLDVVDHRPRHARTVRGALVVANHISVLDILAVAAVSPARFVAKHEVLAMAAGPLLRCFGVLPHRRGDLRALPPALARVSSILDRGRPVAVFPEGTTWCGIAAGRFRPAFFQAALDTGVPVLPLRIAYRSGGRTCTAPGFVGDDEVGDTLGRVLRARSLRVRVVVHPLQLPTGDRRTLAARCEALINPVPPPSPTWERALWAGTPAGAILDRRSCPSISTTPPPPRSSPRPSRR